MNVRLQAMVTAPVLAVAVWSLAHDEGVESFFRKVVVTWIFFSLLHAFVTALWRFTEPGEPEPEAPPGARGATSSSASAGERASAAASNAPATPGAAASAAQAPAAVAAPPPGATAAATAGAQSGGEA